MKSLFKVSDNAEVIARINKLSNTTPAQWGKMDVAQMLKHCQAPLKVAFNELEVKRGLMGILFGGMIRKNLVKDEKPFDRNLPTDKSFLVADKREFLKERENLVALISRFGQAGPQGIPSKLHPFFGKMTAQEWDILQWKHIDHHLRQFGV